MFDVVEETGILGSKLFDSPMDLNIWPMVARIEYMIQGMVRVQNGRSFIVVPLENKQCHCL